MMWRTLDELYPESWALLLTPLCSRKPHNHGGARAFCTSVGKRPVEKKWNDDALARWESGTGRESHLRSIAKHVASDRNIGLVIPPGYVGLDADSAEAFAFLTKTGFDAPIQESSRGGHVLFRIPAAPPTAPRSSWMKRTSTSARTVLFAELR